MTIILCPPNNGYVSVIHVMRLKSPIRSLWLYIVADCWKHGTDLLTSLSFASTKVEWKYESLVALTSYGFLTVIE